ncbi:MAG: DNA polymerase IV [Betaproteobacteria bacterium]|nr:DNA polymerase IV [Betaproteobacteria bacterium]
MARVIAHLDMDAFYASVELLRYPELRGQPVVIGGSRRHHPVSGADGARAFAKLGDYAGRGVVTTATYEARAFGVHSGMGLMKSAKLCPQAVLLPADFDEYRRYSRAFKAAVTEIAPVVEDRGIDEIYIDLTSLVDGADDGGRSVALAIKASVRRETGLVCSIGLSPNKLLSKICSDLDKPDGLTILRPEDIPHRIWPLPAARINGIGPKAAAKLGSLGIGTIGELAGADPGHLIAHFGQTYGRWLHAAAHGRDDRPVVTFREPKSISRELTFEQDLHPRHDRERLRELFTRLCEQVASDLARKGYAGRTIGIKLRYDNFRTVTRDITIERHTADAATIRRAAGTCLRRVSLDRRLRLLGVRVGTLVPAGAEHEGATASAGHPVRPADPGDSSQGTLPLFDASD